MLTASQAEGASARFELRARLAGAAVIVAGLVGLAGWAFGIDWAKSVLPGLAAMKANTALALALAGIATLLLAPARVADAPLRWANTLAVVVAAIGAASLVQTATGLDFGVDELLVRDPGSPLPGRMAPGTALGLVLAGAALLGTASARPGLCAAAQVAGALVVLLGLLAALGYQFGIEELYRVGPYTGMALHTALALFVLGLGILALRPRNMPVAVFTSGLPSAVMGVRLLTSAAIVIVFVGWLRLAAERAGWFGTGFGITLMVLGAIVVTAAVIWLGALRAARIERSLRESEQRLAALVREDEAIFLNSPAAMLVVRGMSLVRANPAFARIFGYGPGEVEGRTARIFYASEEECDAHVARIAAALRERGLYTDECAFLRKDGTRVWMDARATALDLRDPAAGVIWTAVDVTERRAAEAELRASEARYRGLTALSADWYWEQDAEYRFTRLDGAWLVRYGELPARALGKRRWELGNYGNLTPEQWAAHRALLDARQPFRDLELAYTAPDGAVRWMSTSGEPVFDERGEFTGYRGVARDITERVEQQERFAALARENEAIVVNSPAAVLLERGRVTVRCNPALANALGYEPREVEGRSSRLFFASDAEYAAESARVAAAMREKGRYATEEAFVHRDGHRVWMDVRATALDPAHLSAGIVWTAVDISERKAAEAALRESEERFRSLTELSSDFYWEQDENCRFVARTGTGRDSWAPGLAEFAGKARWELPTLNMSEADWAKHRADLEAHREFRGLELLRVRASGAKRWVSVSGRPIFDADGRFRGYRGVGTDITARKEAEQALQRLNAELESRVSERTRELEAAVAELEGFSYSVSHDLRAPLRAINGFSRMLAEREGERLDAESRRLLERVELAALRMGELIDSLLEFSRLGRTAMHVSALDMTALAESVIGELRGGYPAAEAVVGDLPAARGDPVLLRQVLVNLIGNAFKYSSRAERPRVEVVAERGADGAAVFCVRDNGAGFDARYMGKLFQPFQRLHGESEFPGSGIGLALARRIVERHGGRIWAESTPGAGATFRFTLGPAPAA